MFPKQDRSGGLSGQEEFTEMIDVNSVLSDQKRKSIDDTNNLKIFNNREDLDVISQDQEDKLLDRRRSKIDIKTEVFGKPNVLIRNNPNF